MRTSISDVAKYRAFWLGCVPLLPVVAIQGRRLLKRMPLLPEASGARSGIVDGGSSARRLSLAVLGESTAAGVGVASHHEGLAYHVASLASSRLRCDVRWLTVGRTGATLAKVTRHLEKLVEPHADVVIVLLGVNDTMRITSERSWAHGVHALATKLHDSGARRVVFSGLPPVHRFPSLPNPLRTVMGMRAKLMDAVLREVTATIPYTSYAPVEFESDQGLVASDGFHPSRQGYAAWAKNVGRHVIPLLERDMLLSPAAWTPTPAQRGHA